MRFNKGNSLAAVRLPHYEEAMSLPSRMLVAMVLLSFSSCATHDRLAYQPGYWRGRNVKSTTVKVEVDTKVQKELDQAAGAPSSPALPGNTLPPAAPTGGSAPAPATTPSPFEGIPAGAGF